MVKRHKCVKYFNQQQQQRSKGSAHNCLDEANVKVLKKHSHYSVKGLHNVGNTCYLNSSVQCLSRSPCFHELLSLPALRSATLKKPDGESITTMHITLPIMKASVTTRFYELAGQLREVRSDSYATTLNPGSLREAILEKYPRFSGFGQQDSHELLRALLDCMKQEELMRWRKGILDKLNLDMKNIQLEDRELVRSWGRAASIATIVDRLFGGIMVCSLQCCVCGTIRTTFEPFLDLSLPITDSKAPVGRRVSEGSCSHRGTGKSKQELKRERKKKHKNPKREQRRKRKHELNDLGAVSSDFDCEYPPVAVEDDVTKTDSDACEVARQDNSMADIPLETPTPNDVYETGDDWKERFSYSQTGSDVPHVQPQSDEPGLQQMQLQGSSSSVRSSTSSKGSCADAEDSDEDKLGVSTPASHSPPTSDQGENSVPIEPISYLTKQLNELHMDAQDFETFGSEEFIQASRLSQIPLRACVFDGMSHGPNDSSRTLYSCLSRFTAPERLTGSNQIICESCGKGHDNKGSGRLSGVSQRDSTHTPVYRDAIRRDLILEAPPLLTIHLKRFQQFGSNLQKSQKPISFPIILDITPFCSALYLSACNSVCYRLYGVVEHIGRLAGGHYVAYVAVDPSGSSGSEHPDKLKTLFKQFITPLDHPPKWPLTSHDLVRRLRRCDRTQLLKSMSDLSSFLTRESNLDEMNAVDTQSFTEPTEPDDRVWFCCSDSHVTKVSLATVRNCQPFLLFYERLPS